MFVKVNKLGAWTVWEAAVAHIEYVGSEATEAVEPKHRPDLNSAEAVAEPHVPVLQSFKAESVSLRKLDSNS